MTDIVIQAENLGKKYTIGHQTERNRDLALRDVNAKLSPFAICHSPFEAVWALKDVSFEIRRGEFAPNYGIIETRTGVKILGSNRGV